MCLSTRQQTSRIKGRVIDAAAVSVLAIKKRIMYAYNYNSIDNYLTPGHARTKTPWLPGHPASELFRIRGFCETEVV